MLQKRAKALLFVVLLCLFAVPSLAAVSPGRVTVDSVPTGALACIDNFTCDTTSATFTAEGNAWHTIQVTEKGYRDWTESVYVISDQTSMVSAYLDLDPNVTAIQVTLTQGSGTVCLDNGDCRANVGTAGSSRSTLFTGVSPGYHTISVAGAVDYADTTQLVQVNLGKTTGVSIDLRPFISQVTPAVTITPAGSINPSTGSIRVYVDRTGSTICADNGNCFINVGGIPGPGTGTVIFSEVTADEPHIITVAADGYKPVSVTIVVGKDQIATADVRLQPITGGTTVPTLTSTLVPTTLPAMPTTRSGLDAVPVIGALVLCGAIFLFRK